MAAPNEMLSDTPYLIPEDDLHLQSFARTAARSAAVARQAVDAQERIGQHAEALLEPFLRVRRSDLVAESNQIEGYEVSRKNVLQAVLAYEELLRGDVHGIMQAMRADPKIVTRLGLYKAQEIADEWAGESTRPRAYELRQLHSLIVADPRFGGKYRTTDVAIGGTKFRPPFHFDVPKNMDNFCAWWSGGTGDPVLDATVAHAWLTHIHPYEDGNGRLARLLANFVLAQSNYPPLVVRAGRDRGEYYDALAISDAGDIMPLYELFASVIRRTVKEMSSANYAREFLEDRLLASRDDQREAWLAQLASFRIGVTRELAPYGWSFDVQGVPDRTAFTLLANRDADGNGWWAKIRDERGASRWLLWFGFNTLELLDLFGEATTGYPSIFVSRRDLRPSAIHPYAYEKINGLFDELFVRPLEASPITWRTGFDLQSGTAPYAAAEVARQLVSSI